jgi:predicted HD phosphohydrolase
MLLRRSPHDDILGQIEALFYRHGGGHRVAAIDEPVDALQHALQCAHLAERDGASPPLVVAALLHDVGHFVALDTGADAVDDVHELRALGLLACDFGRAVLEPIRLHVQAKRFLVATDADYVHTLTAASAHTLSHQGGAMSRDEVPLFERLPFSADAVRLRRWDDHAKEPDRRTPSLASKVASGRTDSCSKRSNAWCRRWTRRRRA